MIQRQGVAQGFENGSIEADQRKAFEPLPAEGIQGQRPVVSSVRKAECRSLEPALEADEAKDGQRVGERPFVARQAIDQAGHAPRISQDERQHGRVPRGGPLLRGRQPGDLGDQDASVGVVGSLQPEVFAPVQQQVGRGVVAQHIAQPAKLVGMLLVKEDRLDIQSVEQRQPAQAVGPLDRLGIPPKSLRHPGDQVAIRRL